MYIHPKLRAFTEQLEALFHEVDEALETTWAGRFALHPNRPPPGATANPELDGLFEIAPDFTVGIGSAYGRGYLVSCRVATLDQAPQEWFDAFLDEAAALIRDGLPRYFPGRDLTVVRDGARYKIIGDFSLGTTE